MGRLRNPFGYREPLTPLMRAGVMAFVVACHAGGVWGLGELRARRITVGDVQTIEMRFEIAPPHPPALGEHQATREVERLVEPPRPQPPQLEAKEVPPDPAPPQLEVRAAPLPLDVAPSDFVKPPPRPAQPPPPQQAARRAANESEPPPADLPSERTTGHRIVKQADMVAIEPIKLVYPERAAKARHRGAASLRVLVDADGKPSEVWVMVTTHYAELDAEAIRAIRAARFKPYTADGGAEAVWVDILAVFILKY